MFRLRTLVLSFSVFIFSFLFIYQPALVRAQSIEDLRGIQSGIGGETPATVEENDDNYAVYVLVGAAVIAVALYYYLKWAEKKRPSSKKMKTAEKSSLEKKTGLVENATNEAISGNSAFVHEKLASDIK